MFIVFFVLVIVLWIIRIVIFYWYEDNEYYDRDEVVCDWKLDVYYVYFFGSLISFFMFVYIVFVFCYVVLVLGVVLFGILEMFILEIKRNLELVF